MFLIDDLVAIALFALMGKLACDVITEKPNYDDDHSTSSTYRFGPAFREQYYSSLPSLNTAREEPHVAISPFPSPSRRYRFDKWTGEWNDHD